MSLLNKIALSPTACKIALYFSAIVEPSTSESLGGIYSTDIISGTEEQLYSSSGSVSFREVGKETENGTIYTATLTFSLPTTDALRAQRIEQFKKVRYISLILSNGAKLFFGRNDIDQNTKPKVQISSDEKRTKIEFQQKNIAPLGFQIQSNFIFQDEMIFIFQDGSEFIF